MTSSLIRKYRQSGMTGLAVFTLTSWARVSAVQFSQQLVSQCYCETSCWRTAQRNMGCFAIFLLREALHEVELSSTFRNGLQQLTTPLHSVSPLQQLFSQFYGSFNKGACAHFLFFVPRSIARQVAEKIAQCNRASTPNLGNLQR